MAQIAQKGHYLSHRTGYKVGGSLKEIRFASFFPTLTSVRTHTRLFALAFYVDYSN